MRFTPPVNKVIAHASRLVPTRLNPETGEAAKVGVADSVQVLTEQEDGSVGVYRLSGVVHHQKGMGVTLFGSKGTLEYDFERDLIRGAQTGQETLLPLEIPADLRGGWSVETDFVAAIRGEKAVSHTDFLTGAKYMQFTEAVAELSASTACAPTAPPVLQPQPLKALDSMEREFDSSYVSVFACVHSLSFR